MKRGSVKPFGGNYEQDVLKDAGLATRVEPVAGVFSLESRKTFVFRVEQELGSALLHSRVVYGQATARSSVGRVDVLTRLIVDGMDTYESFDPEGVGSQKGRMFIEVSPLTFNVLVKPGESLSQLRLFKGRPEDCEIRGEVLYRSVLKGAAPSGVRRRNEHGTLSVDLSNAPVGKSDVGCAFRARGFKDANERRAFPVPLWKAMPKDRPDPKDFWELLPCDCSGKQKYLNITKERFYILRSRERIALPPSVAVYCRATDETIGEMRIHYAGFVHPGFGFGRKDGSDGTPLIFEVRGHDVEVMLSDEEVMARLTFYRMSADAQKKSAYDKQTLLLSNFFKPWH